MMGAVMRKAFLVEQYEAELPVNFAMLQAVPSHALDWKPHPESFSIGRLAMHVASIPGWIAAFTRGASYDMGAGGPGPAVPASHDEILATFATAVANGRQVLSGLDATTLADAWSLLRDGAVVATMTRGEAIARYVIRHTVHHRGQLSLYLRLRGVPVPPLYGDTADLRLLPPGTAS
jgi:uncharacterized damage-inducible protein DinB